VGGPLRFGLAAVPRRALPVDALAVSVTVLSLTKLSKSATSGTRCVVIRFPIDVGRCWTQHLLDVGF